MNLYLVAFTMPSGHHHHHGEGCCGGNHETGDTCGGHDHETDHHEADENTGFKAFTKEVEKLYPDFLPLFDGLWLINADKNHQEIYQSLKHTIDSHSALWILPAPKESAGFLKPDALEWIKPRLYPKTK